MFDFTEKKKKLKGFFENVQISGKLKGFIKKLQNSYSKKAKKLDSKKTKNNLNKKKSKKTKKEKNKDSKTGKFSRLKKVLKFISSVFLGFFDVVLFFSLMGFFIVLFYYVHTPDVSELREYKSKETSVIYDRTGNHVLYKIFGEENRRIISHEEIPDNIRNATIAAEDDSFYEHFGIDLKSVARAMKVNIKSESIQQGASTITQQLVKSVFLSGEKTYERKLKEAVLAIKVEREFSKDEILDRYLNEIPYGANAYGIQSASQTYFRKDAKELTLDEAALLAALPNAPTFFDPYGKHQKELIERQQMILDRIKELGLASSYEIQEAKNIDTLAKVEPLIRAMKAPHFVFFVMRNVEEEYGREFLERGGLHIITSLDLEMQSRAENILANSRDHLKSYGASNASLVAIDPKTGHILAMVGSVDYFDKEIDGEVNVSVSERQPGSSFKPIIYARAFEEGLWPETLMYDVRTDFGPDGSGKNYIPQNYDGRFNGLVTIRRALGTSLNIPAVKALYLVGIDDAIDMAERLGMTTLTERNKYGLALSLGGGAVKLLEEVSAFSVFANDGKRNPWQDIIEIRDSQGKVVKGYESQEERVMDAEVARKMNSVLSDNIARSYAFGLNNSLNVPGRQVAAKTGTTQDYRDAWTVGYTPSLAVGVWAGNNDYGRPMKMGAAGLYVAAPIWNQFMKESLASYPNERFVNYQKPVEYKPMISAMPKTKITYYKSSSGKKISEEKASKRDPEDVVVKSDPVEFSILHYLNEEDSFMQEYDERMVDLWNKSIKDYLRGKRNKDD